MTVLPPAPNWFSAQILSSTIKGYVAYGAKNSIVVLKCKPQAHFCNNTTKEENEDIAVEEKNPKIEVPECLISSSPFSERAKVTSVCWSPDSTKLAATSDDGCVKIFAVDDSISCSSTHTVHREISRDRHKVNAVSWSKANSDIVISGDEIGNLVILDVKCNATRNINFGKHCIFVLETHPFESDVVAFGCRLGLVFIVNVTGHTGKVIQKIRGHDKDIQSLSWSPTPYRDCFLEEYPSSINEAGDPANSESCSKTNDLLYETEQLIAIASREQVITIWSMKTGRQIAILRLPGTGGEKAKNRYITDKQTFSAIYWWKQGTLLSSGINGELLEWNLKNVTLHGDGIYKSIGVGSELQVLHNEHSRTLYSISSTGRSIQTVGQDRSILSFNRISQSLDFNLPAFGSWIYAIVANSVDPKIIAVAAGDGQIRVWNLASNKAMFDVNVVSQKLNNAKVTALAWHPDKDNIIAFATDEGRVGFVDAFSARAIPTFSAYNHRSMIYNLCWAPVVNKANPGCENKDILEFHTPQKVLYSLGDGKVVMHSFRKDEKAVNVEDIISATNELKRKEPSRTELHFQPNHFKYMVIGSDDGSIEIFAMPDLQLVCTLKSFHQLIQSIAWHPEYVGDSDKQSSLGYMLATASNEHDVHVWDLSKCFNLFNQTETSNDISKYTKNIQNETQCNSFRTPVADSPVFTNPTIILNGHHQRVTYLTWSPHENGQLLSVSYDGTAQIWDVERQAPLSNFSGHNGRLVSGLWSPISANHVFTGGEDCTVYEWNIKQQKNNLPIRKACNKKHRKKEQNPTNCKTEYFSNEGQHKKSNEPQEIDRTSDQEDCPLDNSENKIEIGNREKGTNITASQIEKVYFPVSYQYENQTRPTAYDECQKLYKLLSYDKDILGNDAREDKNHPKIDKNLRIFVDGANIDDILSAEKSCLNSHGNNRAVCYLTQWSGELNETIKTASQSGKLSDWLVSASAGVSFSLWKQMCEAYAIQLVKGNEILKASSYYLMIHKVEEAIEVLKTHHFYRSAITLIKSRLPQDSPLLKSVYKSWAYQATKDGNYELASKCWIAAADYLQAANLLAKRPTTSSLRVASYLAAKSGEEVKSRIFANQCATQCISNNDWGCMEQLVNETNDIDITRMWNDTKDLRNNNIESLEKATSKTKHMVGSNETLVIVASEKTIKSVNSTEIFFDCD